MIKEHVCKRVRLSNCFGLLCDDACDISCKEQLVTFLKFVDPDTGKATKEFLAIDDVWNILHLLMLKLLRPF